MFTCGMPSERAANARSLDPCATDRSNPPRPWLRIEAVRRNSASSFRAREAPPCRPMAPGGAREKRCQRLRPPGGPAGPAEGRVRDAQALRQGEGWRVVASRDLDLV